jgi:hypothetical protein
MIRIVKNGITFECDTADDVRLAMSVLEPVPTVADESWSESDDSDETFLTIVPNHVDLESDLRAGIDYPSPPKHVAVKRIMLDVLEAVMLFPEGVETRGVATLLGLTEKAASNRIQSLKRDGLVEMVPHHHRWVATTLARRAKLVAC